VKCIYTDESVNVRVSACVCVCVFFKPHNMVRRYDDIDGKNTHTQYLDNGRGREKSLKKTKAFRTGDSFLSKTKKMCVPKAAAFFQCFICVHIIFLSLWFHIKNGFTLTHAKNLVSPVTFCLFVCLFVCLFSVQKTLHTQSPHTVYGRHEIPSYARSVCVCILSPVSCLLFFFCGSTPGGGARTRHTYDTHTHTHTLIGTRFTSMRMFVSYHIISYHIISLRRDVT